MKSVLCGVMQTDAPESMMSRLLSLVMVLRHVGLLSVVMWQEYGGVVIESLWIAMMSLGTWFASNACTEGMGIDGSLRL